MYLGVNANSMERHAHKNKRTDNGMGIRVLFQYYSNSLDLNYYSRKSNRLLHRKSHGRR